MTRAQLRTNHVRAARDFLRVIDNELIHAGEGPVEDDVLGMIEAMSEYAAHHAKIVQAFASQERRHGHAPARARTAISEVAPHGPERKPRQQVEFR